MRRSIFRRRYSCDLLVAQVALCVVLLVGAGLFVKSLLALRAHDVGIDLDRVVHTVLPDRPGMRLPEIEGLYAQAKERLGGIPGVEHVTIARASAPMGISTASSILREGWTLSDLNGRSMPSLSIVSPDYFATLGASVERGRGLTVADESDGSRVAGVLTIAGVAAAVVPARRSTAIDPLVVLKSE